MPRAAIEPIGRNWKISKVLERFPRLLEVLIGMSPRFHHLRNPVLRAVQTRLVTVEQAARVGDLDPAWMVDALNRAAGLESPAEADAMAEAASPAEPPAWLEGVDVAEELDVRSFHERGQEPLSAIIAAARRVPLHRALRLRNTFDPAPLYDVLRKQGFEGWGRRRGPDDWEIYFLHGREPRSDRPVGLADSARRGGTDGEPRVEDLDVSDLVPPEPMVQILASLEALPPGSVLRVTHVRRPMHLYPRLDELGCRHETRETAPNRVEIRIEKPS